jgi:hypothetical protein
MNKVAFDLDGVLVPDCDQMPQLGGLSEFYALAYHMRPLFKPEGQWSIITARNPKYRPQTMAWIDNHFSNKPTRVWHEIGNEESEEYKATVINQNGITHYIESDPKIVQYLLANTKAKIIHFDQFCSNSFLF